MGDHWQVRLPTRDGESVTGKTLHSFTEAMPDFSQFSPQRSGLASQQRAERILADRATELGAVIRFGTELESFEQDDDQVTACLRDPGGGEPATISARYLVAADGHKGTVRAAAGISVHGRQRTLPRRPSGWSGCGTRWRLRRESPLGLRDPDAAWSVIVS